jgi:hypothetical protein
MTLFILAVIGMTHIVVDSEIMEPVETWAEDWLPSKLHYALFNCYQCSGFWCGVMLGLLIVSFNPFVVFACGCAGSFLADFSETIFQSLEGLHHAS